MARYRKPGQKNVRAMTHNRPPTCYATQVTEPLLEDVFKTGGVPTHTFVKPQEYTKLLVSLRSPGRGLIIEGPSGIGKTTAVEKALSDLNFESSVTKLTARKPDDVEYIMNLPTMGDSGVVIVDDFHRLPRDARTELADFLKVLADTEDTGTKLIVVGINRAGQRLLETAHDLVNRVDIIPFEANPEHKVQELIAKGEHALNIKINIADGIIREARGSFYIAQMLCHEVCIRSEITERQDTERTTEVSLESVRSDVWQRLSLVFDQRCRDFCRGTKMKKQGRAPYLHILKWLATGTEWTLNLREEKKRHISMEGSVGQVVDKGFLRQLMDGNPDIQKVLHFDEHSTHITVNDPQFMFYIRNIPWRTFARDLGFVSVNFRNRYDFALSFSGADRELAQAIATALMEAETEVFYDFNEQHRILAEDIEEYLRPIYESEAAFIICILSQSYPERIWTRFESDAFRSRLVEGAVIAIRFKGEPASVFDKTGRYGSLQYDPEQERGPQVERMVATLLRKLEESRDVAKLTTENEK